MNQTLKNVMSGFDIEGEYVSSTVVNTGHINDTYIVDFLNKSGPVEKYVVQRINHNVFKHPDKLMENIIKVTNHIKEKVLSEGGDPRRQTLNFIKARNGKTFFQCVSGNYWRMYSYIGGAITYQIVENNDHFKSAGRAFGIFQRRLNDFSVGDLHETIPDFHNTPKRFEHFVSVLAADPLNRAIGVKDEIEYVLKKEGETGIVVGLLETGEIPLKVTHNDTKFNNVLIDENTGEGICVIDLDTVMPGSILYDFGDSIRSGATRSKEDERDLSKITLDLNLYENFTMGYLEAVGSTLTQKEIQLLPFSANLITYELGMRFLTDHINGDTYFKVHRENHNLDRAKAQFKLAMEIENNYERMEAIVQKHI